MRGFLWASNNPYLRDLWFTVRRAPVGLSYPMVGPDANGAAIIYECFTDTTWGMGTPTSLVDLAGFNAAAETLNTENFGISLPWVKQSSIDDFVNIVLQHIDGLCFPDPVTGMHTLRLIRGDYDIDTLPDLNPDNAQLVKFQRRSWEETINEVTLTWTNPANEQEETVTLQSLGNIARQGAVVPTSINMFGIRSRSLAMEVCARELRKASAATATAEMRVLRANWNLRPGDVVTVTWPDEGIAGVVMRVTEIDYGAPGDPYIGLTLGEDIYSLSRVAYTVPPDTGWVDPSKDPTAVTDARTWTLPGYVASQMLDASLSALEDSEIVTGVLAATENTDANGYELDKETMDPNGDTSWSDQGFRPFLGAGLLPVELDPEPFSLIPALPQPVLGTLPGASGLILFDTGGEDAEELALVDSIDEDGYHLRRGVLDTVPKRLPVGTKMWYLDTNSDISDPTLNAEGETVEYKLLMETSRGRLSLDDAPVVSGTMSGRPHYPNRPANVAVAGVHFADDPIDIHALDNAPVTWARRNRLTEEVVVLAWNEGDVTPETGQTTTVRVLANDGAVLETHTGLAGTSFDVPVTDFGTELEGQIEVLAERDGYSSLQSFRLPVSLTPAAGRLLEESTATDRWFRRIEDDDFRVLEDELDWLLPLVNPGAEAGNTSGWTNDLGAIDVRSSSPSPYEGSYYFTGGNSAESKASQVVAIPNGAVAYVQAGQCEALIQWAQTSYSNSDEGQVILSLLDENGTLLTEKASTLVAADKSQWTVYTLKTAVPANCRQVRVTLRAVRKSGGNNDAYFDSVRAGLALVSTIG